MTGPVSENCPAGLDIITPLKLGNEPSSFQTTSDSSSYVKVEETRRGKFGSRRGKRLPLGDNSNVVTDVHLSADTTRIQATLLPTLEDPIGSVSLSSGLSLPSFQLLPPLPCASSLQLPSFLDFSPHKTILSGDLFPDTRFPLQLGLPIPFTTNDSSNERGSASDAVPASNIPLFMHPNSPYVPWPPQMRRDIICSPTSVSPSSNTIDRHSHSCSRTGTKTPEPMSSAATYSHQTRATFFHMPQSLRSLTLAVRKHVKHAVQRISRLKRRHNQSVALPIEMTCPACSINSLDSSETTTLATWLVDRQVAMEGDPDLSNAITLEEYERKGSWMNIRNPASGNAGPTSGNVIRRSLGASREDGNHFSRRGSLSTSFALFHSHSDSRLCGHSGLLESQDGASSPDRQYNTVKREREISMPGGWIFNH